MLSLVNNAWYNIILYRIQLGIPVSLREVISVLNKVEGGTNCCGAAIMYLNYVAPILIRRPDWGAELLPYALHPLMYIDISTSEKIIEWVKMETERNLIKPITHQYVKEHMSRPSKILDCAIKNTIISESSLDFMEKRNIDTD